MPISASCVPGFGPIPLLALLALALWFAGDAWVHLAGDAIPLYGYVAIAGGVLISLLVGGGLMALVFYSSRHGYDDLGRRRRPAPLISWRLRKSCPRRRPGIAARADRAINALRRPAFSDTAMSKTLVQEQFGKTAASYLTSKPHALGKSLERMVALTAPQKTGARSTSRPAAAMSPIPLRRMSSASGRPTSPRKCSTWSKAEAQKRGLANLRTTYAKAEALPFEDASFDLVTCRIAPHHFDFDPAVPRRSAPRAQAGRALALVDNVVPAGSVGDYINAFERFRDPSHLRAWTMEEWRDALKAAGFAVTHEEQIYKTDGVQELGRAPRRHHAGAAALDADADDAGGESGARAEEAGGDITFRLCEGLFIAKRDLAAKQNRRASIGGGLIQRA